MLGGDSDRYGKGTQERQSAKALNFGIPGGLGVKKMYAYGKQSYGLDWSRSEAEELYMTWLEAYPDVAEYLKRFKVHGAWTLRPMYMKRREWLESLGFDENPSNWDLTMALDKGRLYNVQLPSGARLPARNYTQGTNSAFQHLGAVATSHAINKCFIAGLPVIAAVHDAVYLAVPYETGGRATNVQYYKNKLEELMEQALYETCPLAPRQKVEAEVKETFF
jgi:DNA polymerase I-like protein with 3'-5' exonuclease and polymerase domains